MKVTICDRCGKVIPVITKTNFLGQRVSVLDKGHIECKEYKFDDTLLDNDFCKDCAKIISLEMDNAFLKFRQSVGG